MAVPVALGAWIAANWVKVALAAGAVSQYLWAHRRVVVGVVISVVIGGLVYYLNIVWETMMNVMIYSRNCRTMVMDGLLRPPPPGPEFARAIARANYFFPAGIVFLVYSSIGVLLAFLAAMGYACLSLRIFSVWLGVKLASSKVVQSTKS